jgi:hypothetical protein
MERTVEDTRLPPQTPRHPDLPSHSYLLGALVTGIGVGIASTITYYRSAQVREHAEEEALAMSEELYAAWAALRAGILRPPPDNM